MNTGGSQYIPGWQWVHAHGGEGDEFYKGMGTSSTGGSETRPRNIALLAIIKY